MDDVRVVMDAAGSEQAALFGLSEGGPVAIMFAAAAPDRVRALVTFEGFTKTDPAPITRRQRCRMSSRDWLRISRMTGGTGGSLALWIPSRADDPWEGNRQTDVRPLLPSIRAPALVIHRANSTPPVFWGRYLDSGLGGGSSSSRRSYPGVFPPTGARLLSEHERTFGTGEDVELLAP